MGRGDRPAQISPAHINSRFCGYDCPRQETLLRVHTLTRSSTLGRGASKQWVVSSHFRELRLDELDLVGGQSGNIAEL